MKISYVIPVFNGSASIAKCLEHILYQQGDFEREIIVVNDGSTDDTFDIVQNYVYDAFNNDGALLGKVFLYDRGHLGASAARNFGVSKATGDYIAMVDADTLLDITWTQQCLSEPADYDILLTNDLKYHEEDPVCRQLMEKIQKNPYITHQNLIGLIGNGTFLPAKNKWMINYDEMYIVGGEDIDILFRLIDSGARLKASYGPSFLHKHMHSSQAKRYLSFIKKKVLFGYGNWRTFFKHRTSVYAIRDAMNNFWVLPLYPFIAAFVKLRLFAYFLVSD